VAITAKGRSLPQLLESEEEAMEGGLYLTGVKKITRRAAGQDGTLPSFCCT